ncbi:hypothetical protein AAEX28_03810 [Lentisphaerota bacterium WC36G]|nr:hypothetical protein LJT99_06685 [Lentisphaerae bacterium WC36]
MIYFKFMANSVFIIVLLLLCNSCQQWLETSSHELQQQEEAKLEKKRIGAIITINNIIKEYTNKKYEVLVPSFWEENEKLCVNKNSLLTPESIETIERLPNDKVANTFDLILHLNDQGLMKYDIMETTYANKKLALLVDGQFYKAIEIAPLIDKKKNSFFIPGPFSDNLSKKIVEKAPVNYRYYNGIEEESNLQTLERLMNPQ